MSNLFRGGTLNALLTLAFILQWQTGAAQTDTLFYDAYGYKCVQKEAETYVLVRTDETGQYLRSTFYMNHQPESRGYVLHADSTDRVGLWMNYGRNGKVCDEGSYLNGTRDGKWKHYYETGELWYMEQYKNGELDSLTAWYTNGPLKHVEWYPKEGETKGIRYKANGKKDKFQEFRTMATPGYNVNKYLAKHIRYPNASRENNIEGQVLLRFVVSETGKIERIKVVEHVSPDIDAEAYRVVSAMPKWKPGMLDGKPVNIYFHLPIMFKLE